MTNVAALAQAEVVDLHALLQGWFCGEGPMVPGEILSHFDPGFRMVSPAGRTVSLAAFSSGFPTIYGSRPKLVMTILDFETIHEDRSSVLATYRERQTWVGNSNERLSTVLLLKTADCSRLLWRSLHETLLTT